jgi:hypothetical protein
MGAIRRRRTSVRRALLARDDANFLTGVVLEVDGGRCI